MSIAVVSMIRNEADRYLRSALSVWQELADEIIVYDDNSNDGSPELLRSVGAKVLHPANDSVAAWGNESIPRAMLWDRALESKCDWLFWLDADMIPAADPRDLTARNVDAISFRLYDLWDWRSHFFRADGHWKGHNNPRIWMIRNPRNKQIDWQWNQRGMHCGHMPMNYEPTRVILAPTEYSILHYGYAEATDRSVKVEQYASQEAQLSVDEILHARSIADEAYVAFPLPFKPTWHLTHHRAAGKQSESLWARAYAKTKPSLMPTGKASVR